MQRMRLRTLVALLLLGLSACDWLTGGTFTVVQGYRDGHPLFLTIDTSLRDGKAKRGFPWFLSISTPLKYPTKDGLTNEAEASELNAWEDGLEKEISRACRFVHVGRVTWNRTRELLYYVDTPDSVAPGLEKLAAEKSNREFHVQIERDDQWAKVSSYVEMIPAR